MRRRGGEERLKLRPGRILAGHAELIFEVLPESVLENFRHPGSENALLWNQIYPLAQPTLSLGSLLALRPLWGTHQERLPDDQLLPYYWGYSLDGDRLADLDRVLAELDGPGPRTEVDLFLLGARNLILVEAKHQSGLGRCARFLNRRCPEIHPSDAAEGACRYWESADARFSDHLLIGSRPDVESQDPACNRHYQLARTLLVGARLATLLDRTLHLWLITPERRWASLEGDWLDFCDRVSDEALWRRMRVLSWEAISESKPAQGASTATSE